MSDLDESSSLEDLMEEIGFHRKLLEFAAGADDEEEIQKQVHEEIARLQKLLHLKKKNQIASPTASRITDPFAVNGGKSIC